jgi:hypothetical protein
MRIRHKTSTYILGGRAVLRLAVCREELDELRDFVWRIQH